MKLFFWLSFMLSLSLPVLAAPVILTVDTIIDDPTKTACQDAVANDCSLRGALHNTNSNINPGELDTIIVPAGLYVFDEMGVSENDGATGDLDIRQDVMIEGEGADVTTIDANQLDRVFDINPKGNDNAEVIITGLEITGGKTPKGNDTFGSPAGDGEDGGGIRISGGVVTLQDVLITANETGNGGNADFSDPLFDIGGRGGLGGGLYFKKGDELNLENAAIVANVTGNGGAGLNPGSGGSGGGLFVSAVASTARLKNVTISGNKTGEGSGGAGGAGGGLSLWAANATMVLNNVTIADNRTGLDGTSISGSGGGLIVNNGTLLIGNSIVAANQVGSSGSGPDCFGTITSQGSNLVGDDTDCVGLDVGQGDTVGAPKLAALADNGGATLTHALMSDSPAVGLGGQVEVCEETDQRGFGRLADGQCDSGAFELGACGDGVVTDGEDCDIGDGNDDTCAAGSACVAPGEANECTCVADGNGNGAEDTPSTGGCQLIRRWK